MSKMHYFSNKFSKIAKRWGFFAFPTAPLNLQYWWPAVPWFNKIMVFQVMAKSNLKKLVVTLFQWRHRYYVTQ